jgi:hypothetical protein
MKKEVRKYQVTRKYTESDLKNLGGSLWVKSLGKKGIVILLLFLVYAAIVAFGFEHNKPVMYSVVAILIVGYMYLMYGMTKASRKFWNKVKDLPEPIDLDEVK